MAADRLTVAIFASDKGPGDAERASIMSAAGALFARRGAKIVALGDDGNLPLPALTSARAAGGEVEVYADTGFALPKALESLPLVRIADRNERLRQLAADADCYLALPGSLTTVTDLFNGTLSLEIRKPVVVVNHHHAYEILRGFAVDVLTHGVPGFDRYLQFTDSVEDAWTRVQRLTASRT